MKNRITLLLVAFLCCFGANVDAQIITTIAGDSTTGYNGDNIPAVNAELHGPIFMDLNGAGDLIFSDYYNNRIRKIANTGIITTIVGNAGSGFFGDGGPATDAGLDGPTGLSFDKYGNLFFSDDANSCIRRIDTNGIITTIAGTPRSAGFSGDGGPATAAQLHTPNGVAFDPEGNLYIADLSNCCVRKITISTGIITTVAGIGRHPGHDGDGGPATAARLNEPYGIAIDKTGTLYIADYSNCNARKVDTSGIISTIAGVFSDSGILEAGYNGDNIPATSAYLSLPGGIAVDNHGNVYIGDGSNFRVRKIGNDGIITTVAGNGTGPYCGDGGPATDAGMFPASVTLDNKGDIYIADYGSSRIRLVKNTLDVKALNTRDPEIDLYPNPSNGEFRVNVTTIDNEVVQITVANLLGEIVRDISATTNQPLIVTMDVPTGVYFLTARVAEGAVTKKIEVIR